MSGAHDDNQERLLRARLKSLAAETGVRVNELATLLSTFEAVVWSVHHLEKAGVPSEEFPVVPDPRELLTNEDDMTTGEAVEILRDFLEMSAEGEARLWGLLNLTFEGVD